MQSLQEEDAAAAAVNSDFLELQRLARAVARLPARERTVITLCDLRERSVEEVARALSLVPQQVYSIRSRARQRLKKLLRVDQKLEKS